LWLLTTWTTSKLMLVAHSTTPNDTQVPCHRVPGAQTCLVFRPVWSASCSSRNDRVSEALSHAPRWKLFRTLTSLPSLASFKDFLLLAWLYPLKSKECLTGMPRNLLLLRNIATNTENSLTFSSASGRHLQLGTPRLHLKPRSEFFRGGSNLETCPVSPSYPAESPNPTHEVFPWI
jgi:hypothetical protein